MERNKRKTKQNNKFIIILLSIIIFLLIGTIILLLNLYKKNEEKNKLLQSNLTETRESYNNIIQNNQDLNDELEKISNIEETISKEKEEVFKLASTLEQMILNKKTNYKIAYLTFDDGPYYSTNKYLDILKKYKVKATFFTIGLDKEKCYDNRNKDCSIMYKKIVDNGHTIANHTYSHLIFKGLYNSADSFITQVQKQEDLIKKKTGVKTNIVRFPGGSSSANAYGIKTSAIKKLKEKGYGWVDWTAQDGDGGSLSNKQTGLKNLKNSINENIEVVLMHDYSQITLSILPDIITYLQDNNYILLPLFYESVKVNK